MMKYYHNGILLSVARDPVTLLYNSAVWTIVAWIEPMFDRSKNDILRCFYLTNTINVSRTLYWNCVVFFKPRLP